MMLGRRLMERANIVALRLEISAIMFRPARFFCLPVVIQKYLMLSAYESYFVGTKVFRLAISHALARAIPLDERLACFLFIVSPTLYLVATYLSFLPPLSPLTLL